MVAFCVIASINHIVIFVFFISESEVTYGQVW